MGRYTIFSALLLVTFLPQGGHSQACGKASLNPYIVGGAEASPGSWPWQAYVELADIYGTYMCGGALINRQWILTAAHCVCSKFASRSSVYLGLHDRSVVGLQGVEKKVAQWKIHPLYNCTGIRLDNDIALIKMSTPVTYTSYIQPVCLAQKLSTFHTGVKAWVAGWGTRTEGGSVPNILREVSLPVVGDNQCKCNYTSPIPDKTMCAGYAEGGKDSCQGDSGGPLVVKKGSIWVQAGIVSFGKGCGRPNIPGVYTEVSEFQDWIQNTVGTQDPPGIVAYTSPGQDSDTSYTCGPAPGAAPTTAATATMIYLCLATLNLW